MAAVKDPEDRRPCLTPAATEKNSASTLTKKSDYLRSTQKFDLVGHGVRDDRGLVAALNLRESRSLCLTSLEPAMELDSL